MILSTILAVFGYWLMTGTAITLLMITALGFAHACQYLVDWVKNWIDRP